MDGIGDFLQSVDRTGERGVHGRREKQVLSAAGEQGGGGNVESKIGGSIGRAPKKQQRSGKLKKLA